MDEPSPWKMDPATGILLCEGDKVGHEWVRFATEFSDVVYHVEWRLTKVEGEPAVQQRDVHQKRSRREDLVPGAGDHGGRFPVRSHAGRRGRPAFQPAPEHVGEPGQACRSGTSTNSERWGKIALGLRCRDERIRRMRGASRMPVDRGAATGLPAPAGPVEAVVERKDDAAVRQLACTQTFPESDGVVVVLEHQRPFVRVRRVPGWRLIQSVPPSSAT